MTEPVTEVPQGTVDTAAAHSEPTWYIMDNMPGQGERPDYLEPKYKSMAEQAKAYKELQKTLGATSGAPEKYDLDAFKDYVDPNNDTLKDYLEYAKGNRFTQDAISKTMDTFVKYQKSLVPNIDAEIAKLGPDGARKIETVQRWAENNLSDKSLDALGKITNKAEVVEFLDEVRQFSLHQQSQPPGQVDATSTFKPLSVAEVREEMITNYKKYQDDPAYRKEITKKFEMAGG